MHFYRNNHIKMDKDFLNRDGQPPSSINAKKVMARQQAELSGILKGVACDKVITPSEAKFVCEWLNLHKQVDDGVTYTRLIDALNSLDHATRGTFEDSIKLQAILLIIRKLVNGGESDPSASDLTMDAADNIPADEIVFEGQHFCFTGKLKFGPRSKAAESTEARLGIITDSVTFKLN